LCSSVAYGLEWCTSDTYIDTWRCTSKVNGGQSTARMCPMHLALLHLKFPTDRLICQMPCSRRIPWGFTSLTITRQWQRFRLSSYGAARSSIHMALPLFFVRLFGSKWFFMICIRTGTLVIILTMCGPSFGQLKYPLAGLEKWVMGSNI